MIELTNKCKIQGEGCIYQNFGVPFKFLPLKGQAYTSMWVLFWKHEIAIPVALCAANLSLRDLFKTYLDFFFFIYISYVEDLSKICLIFSARPPIKEPCKNRMDWLKEFENTDLLTRHLCFHVAVYDLWPKMSPSGILLPSKMVNHYSAECPALLCACHYLRNIGIFSPLNHRQGPVYISVWIPG